MYSLVYEPGLPGVDPIDLSGEDYTVGQATGLRSTAWTYTLAAAGLSGVSASARETTLTVSARTPELFDRPGMVFDAEMSLGKPGTLVIDGQWRQRCYVTKTSTTSASRIVGAPSTQSWTVVLLDGVWTRLLPVEHFNPVTSTATGLDLPTDLPLDLAAGGFTRYIQNDSLAPVDWRMTVFGPATDPHVTIGGNIVELTGSIPDGSYVTIDSRRRTITLTRADGSTQNVFDWGVRSTGVGSGHYVFERIPSGQQIVSWPSSFSFDMQLLEERTDPTWGGSHVRAVNVVDPAPVQVSYGAVPQLAGMLTVHWSDGHSSREIVQWTHIPDTRVTDGVLEAVGDVQGLMVTQRIIVTVIRPESVSITGMPSSVTYRGTDLTYSLQAVVSPSTASDRSVTWTVSGPASISDDGTLTITGAGEVRVTVVCAADHTVSSTASVTVIKPATPVSVVKPGPVSAAYGGTIVLPDSLTVRWSDGTTTSESVSWGTIPSSTDSGSHTVTGTCRGMSVSITVTVAAKPQATVTRVDDPTAVTVQQGGSIPLPARLIVRWSDGTTSSETVSWDEQPDTSQPAGTYYLYGTCKGKTAILTYTITAKPVTPSMMTQDQADKLTALYNALQPVAPSYDVNVAIWDAAHMGSVTYKDAQDLIDRLTQTAKDHKLNVPGVGDFSDKTQKTVTSVDSPQPISVDYGKTISLPITLTAHWSDGSTSQEIVVWSGTPSSTDPGAHTVSGQCAGMSVTMQVTVGAKPVTPDKPTSDDQPGDLPDTVDQSTLRAFVARAKKLRSWNYTPDSWGKFQTQLTAAENALTDNVTDTSTLKQKYIKLRNSWNGLVKATVAAGDLALTVPSMVDSNPTTIAALPASSAGMIITLKGEFSVDRYLMVTLGDAAQPFKQATGFTSFSTTITVPKEGGNLQISTNSGYGYVQNFSATISGGQ